MWYPTIPIFFPEVLKNSSNDKSVDFWSLGFFLYEMLTYFLPYYITRNIKLI